MKPRVRFWWGDSMWRSFFPRYSGYWRFVSAADWTAFERAHGIRRMACKAEDVFS